MCGDGSCGGFRIVVLCEVGAGDLVCCFLLFVVVVVVVAAAPDIYGVGRDGARGITQRNNVAKSTRSKDDRLLLLLLLSPVLGISKFNDGDV